MGKNFTPIVDDDVVEPVPLSSVLDEWFASKGGDR